MNQISAGIEPIGASAPLSEQLHQFREFGTVTRLIETGATLFNGGRRRRPGFSIHARASDAASAPGRQ